MTYYVTHFEYPQLNIFHSTFLSQTKEYDFDTITNEEDIKEYSETRTIIEDNLKMDGLLNPSIYGNHAVYRQVHPSPRQSLKTRLLVCIGSEINQDVINVLNTRGFQVSFWTVNLPSKPNSKILIIAEEHVELDDVRKWVNCFDLRFYPTIPKQFPPIVFPLVIMAKHKFDDNGLYSVSSAYVIKCLLKNGIQATEQEFGEFFIKTKLRQLLYREEKLKNNEQFDW